MKFSKIIVSAIALSGFLSACSSKIPEQVAELLPNGYSIDGKAIYLRGEMNDYEEQALKKPLSAIALTIIFENFTIHSIF